MSTEHYNDEEFNLEDDDLVIEVTDDTPEGDKGYAPRDKNRQAVEEYVSEEEMEDWPESAKRRLKKLSWDSNESKREKRAAERERDEAVRMTQAALQESHAKSQLISSGEKILLDQMSKGADSNIANANARLKSAYEEGDADEIVKANADLVEATQAKLYSKSVKPSEVPAAPQQIPAAPQVHPVVNSWVDDNPWFNAEDNASKRKKAVALAVDAEIQAEGITPMADPQKYIEELDKRIAQTVGAGEEAEHLEPESPSRKSVVTPSRRGVEGRGSSKQHVTLTKSQLALAKKLNLTPKQYALEDIRLKGAE